MVLKTKKYFKKALLHSEYNFMEYYQLNNVLGKQNCVTMKKTAPKSPNNQNLFVFLHL